jgi:Asp-tRNA(Asn)/Glu-tRNA(Gln) amidotransferase A subunit family amidase/Asp-tRNA(Asn)/Glu-tRNA(Gln) amidotransferase C subunit
MGTQREQTETQAPDRRRFLAFFSSIGLASTLLPGVLWARVQEEKAVKIDASMIEDAEKIAGLEFTENERELMTRGLNDQVQRFRQLRELPITNDDAPAVQFRALLPSMRLATEKRPFRYSEEKVTAAPTKLEELAFASVTRLAALLRARKIRSIDLTKMYLARLKRFDPALKCVVNLTEELALRQAKRADDEIAAGRYLGPLHGVPWGAKDLLAAKGYPTTWGAKPFADRTIDVDATVVERLAAAGAVLVAKLALGALAWGDVWFDGKTRNPWNTSQGSSGSSAGPGSATSAGLVGFSIGSETWGSIISPSTRCGVTGLRPTFGRVSRHGAMALSWSMDKLGPMCRSVEDCALVLEAIRGPDRRDGTVIDAPFNWSPDIDVKKIRVGYVKALFDRGGGGDGPKNDRASLTKLRELGFKLVEVALPDFPTSAMSFILNAEAAAAFDDLTRSGEDDELTRQIRVAWPNVFRQSRLIPAVEYLQANRARSFAMTQTAQIFDAVDVYVAPSFGGDNMLLTNLTGHPALCVPNGFNSGGTPTSITFTGNLYDEAKLLAVGKAYQDAAGFLDRHPTLEEPK